MLDQFQIFQTLAIKQIDAIASVSDAFAQNAGKLFAETRNFQRTVLQNNSAWFSNLVSPKICLMRFRFRRSTSRLIMTPRSAKPEVGAIFTHLTRTGQIRLEHGAGNRGCHKQNYQSVGSRPATSGKPHEGHCPLSDREQKIWRLFAGRLSLNRALNEGVPLLGSVLGAGPVGYYAGAIRCQKKMPPSAAVSSA